MNINNFFWLWFKNVQFVFYKHREYLKKRKNANVEPWTHERRERSTQFLTLAEYSFESPVQKKENDGTGAWKRFLALYVISFRDDSWDSGAGVFTPVVPSVCTKVILGGSEAGAGRVFFFLFLCIYYTQKRNHFGMIWLR